MNIRQAVLGDESALAYVHVTSWRETYKGIVKDVILDNLNMNQRTEYWRSVILKGEIIIYLAENEDEKIIGFASGGVNRSKNLGYDGELYSIYLLKAYHFSGIGSKLFQKVAYEMQVLGYASLVVWVLEENKAREFYEKFNPKRVGRAYLEGLECFEIAYGWFDITTIQHY